MRYLFDTSAYSNLQRGQLQMAAYLQQAEAILLPGMVVAELRYGFALGKRNSENERLLNRFIADEKVHLLLADTKTINGFVHIATFAHRKGVSLSQHDIWIASMSVQWDATLVTFDKDFEHLGYKKLKLRILTS